MTWLDILLPLLRRSEGLRLEAYRDPVGIWTIGYGRTRGVHEGMRITRDQAEKWLVEDALIAGAAVDRVARDVDLSEHEKAALADFTFNIRDGENALAQSTLMRKLRAGDRKGAADELLRWVWATKPDGTKVKLPGLVRRRDEARAMFLTPDAPAPDHVPEVPMPLPADYPKMGPQKALAVLGANIVLFAAAAAIKYLWGVEYVPTPEISGAIVAIVNALVVYYVPNKILQDEDNSGGGLHCHAWLALPLALVLLGGCQPAQVSSPVIDLSRACDAYAASVRTLAIADMQGKLDANARVMVIEAINVVSPICTADTPPTLTDAQARVISGVIAGLENLALDVKTP